MIESFNDALVQCVIALGGSKQVGPLIWPEKTPEAAQRQLLDCLNEERPSKLSPDQVLMLLRLARAKGCHVGMEYLAEALGYAAPVPVSKEDAADQLKREFIEATNKLAAMAQQIQRIGNAA